jgi:nicotinic acid mononucleotide adenylyltransferase
MDSAIYDLPQLFALRKALETLDVSAPPTARVLVPQVFPAGRRVGLLCGSFNPLTLAHAELAEHARKAAVLDLVLFTVAKVTVEKERVTGLSLEDRLLLLSWYARRHERTGVAIVNRGLYFEQARAFRSLLGAEGEIFFVVGMDKLWQILDPKYYPDRDAALRQLFALASLIVANRGAMARVEFDRLLDQPENRPYRPHIHFCYLPDRLAELSATAVRENLVVGKEVASLVPEETAIFLQKTQAFRPPAQIGKEIVEAYAVRQRLFELLLSGPSRLTEQLNFAALIQTALADTETARALRQARSLEELLQLSHAVLP